MQAQLRVAVTGATGFVGLHTVRALLERGHAVVAVVRGSSDTRELLYQRAVPGLSVARADLGDAGALRQAFAGADAVVHAAGSVDAYGSRLEIRATNVEGTRSALEAARDAGVEHFVHVSSLSVITGRGHNWNVSEEAPLRYSGEAYADSKVDAERLVMAEAGRGRINVTALRPGFIYGPGERAWLLKLIESIRLGRVRLIHGGGYETNVIYVENLCRALLVALHNPITYGEIYNLSDGPGISKKALFDAISDGLDLPPVTRTAPAALVRGLSELVSWVAPALPAAIQRKLGRFSPAAVRLVGLNQGFDIAKAENHLGYKNRIAFHEGMAKTLQHYRRTEPHWTIGTPG